MSVKLITGLKTTADIESQDDGARIYSTISSADRVLNVGSYWGYEIISNNCVRIKDGEALIQGRHVRQAPNTYTDVTINNGEQGKRRYDIIVLRYTKSVGTGIENVELAVVEGTPGTSATVPILTVGDIFAGCTTHEMALYRVYINGLNISSVTKLFTEINNLENSYSSLNSSYTSLNAKVTALATTAEITYYVSPSGSNSNSGTSLSYPFKTLKYALNKLPKRLDHNVTINLASGTYTEAEVVITGFFGGGTLAIVGSWDNPTSRIFSNGIVINRVQARTEFHGIAASKGFNALNSPIVIFYYCKAYSSSYVDYTGFHSAHSKVFAFHCNATNFKNGFMSYQGGELIASFCNCSNCPYPWCVYEGAILYAYASSSSGYTSAVNYGSAGVLIDTSGGVIGHP